MKKEKPILSTLSTIISSNIIMIVGIATGIIVTRSLGPELKGEFANLKLIMSLYAPFLLFGYQGGVLFYGLRQKLDLQQFFYTGAAMSVAMGLLCMPILALFAQNGLLGKIVQNTSPLNTWLVLVTIPILFLNTYIDSVTRVYSLFRAANFRLIIAALVSLVFYLVLWLTIGINITLAIVGFLLGQTASLISSLFFVTKKLRVLFIWQGKYIFYLFTYGYKASLNLFIANTNDKIDQVILTFFLSPAAFAFYAVGVGLSNLVTVLPSSYTQVFFNQMASRSLEESLSLYTRTQRITFSLTTLAALVIIILAYPMVYVMYGTAFADAAWVVVLYTPGLIFHMATRLTSNFFSGQGKPLKNSLVHSIGIAAGLPFYFWFIPKYGINGAAMASTISYIATFCFSFLQLNLDYGVSLKDVIIPQKRDLRYVKEQILKIPFFNKIILKLSGL